MTIHHKSKFFDLEKAEKATEMLLEAIGHDGKNMPHWSENENLKETPLRVAKYWEDVASGYDEDPKRHLKLFPSDSSVVVGITNVPLYSFCSHHLALFKGHISISYVPNGKVIGISKLLRIARVFAKRLQLQEELASQIADFLEEYLSTDVAVDIRAEHTCMTIRGVRVPGSQTITTVMRGKFRTDEDLYTRFLNEAASNKTIQY